MKKLSYTTIILAAACLLLPGCSDDAADKVFVSPDVLVADSEVEIKLSSNSSNMVTRAGLYDGESFSTPTECVIGGNTIEPKLALFCLATGIQDGTSDATEPNWTKYSEDQKSNDVWLKNMESRVWEGNIELNETAFYPLSNWYTYSFYGLYTKQNNPVMPSQDKMDVVVYLNGYDDIIWGKSFVSDEDTQKDYAYSAKYYREHIKEDNPAGPAQMQFHHMLTCFQFQVKPMDDNAKDMVITSIKLKNQPSHGRLCIASKNQEYTEGEIGEYTNATFKDITLYDVEIEKDEEQRTLIETLTPAQFTIEEDMVLETAYDLGGADDPAAFYVMPNQEKYTLIVNLWKDGKDFPPAELDIPIEDMSNVAAGKRNIVKLALYGPQEISLQATLEDWEDTDEDLEIEL